MRLGRLINVLLDLAGADRDGPVGEPLRDPDGPLRRYRLMTANGSMRDARQAGRAAAVSVAASTPAMTAA